MKKLTTPTIYPLDQDVSKTWFVKYPNPLGGEPLKKYGNLAKMATLAEKQKEAQRIIAEELKDFTTSYNAKHTDQLLYDLKTFFEYSTIGKKKKTVSTYSTTIDDFVIWYRTKWRGDDNVMMGLEYIRYLRDKGLSNTTLNKYRSHMKSYFARLVKAGKYPINPFEQTNKLTERRQTKEWFREEQISLIKETLVKSDPQLWLGCRLQFYCFIRPNSELPHTKISDIQIAEKRIRIRAEIGKTSTRDEYIPIPDDMLAEMDRYTTYPSHYFLFSHFGKPGLKKLGKDTLSKRHKAVLKDLSFPKNYSYYSWKNSGAVHMLKAGINILHISMLMRHKSLHYTRGYFKSMGFDDMREDLNKKYPVI